MRSKRLTVTRQYKREYFHECRRSILNQTLLSERPSERPSGGIHKQDGLHQYDNDTFHSSADAGENENCSVQEDAVPIKNVTIIVPTYQEEKGIADCINSILAQDYPRNRLEIIFVDGKSTDKTVEIIKKYEDNYPELIHLFINPQRTQAYAMNIGIKHAHGEAIVRLDAHALYPVDYISKCVYYLNITGATNVGGLVETRGKTKEGKLISKMLSGKFGVGNSQFRTDGESGYVDTVSFGAFRKEFFDANGGFDTRFDRNEDNEINYRIRKKGGKVYLAKDIQSVYFCRDTVSGILNMAFQNGNWNAYTLFNVPGSLGIRHLVPFTFVITIILFSLLGIAWRVFFAFLAIELITYFTLDILSSAQESSKANEMLFLIGVHFLFHFCYGIGTAYGVVRTLYLKIVKPLINRGGCLRYKISLIEFTCSNLQLFEVGGAV